MGLAVFRPRLDFLSTGTNDLTQLLIAADRGNPLLADRYDWLSRALLRFLKLVVDAAKKAGVPVSICGEMGGDIELTPLLVGLGLDDMSVSCGQVPRVKPAVRKLRQSECEDLVIDVLRLCCTSAIR